MGLTHIKGSKVVRHTGNIHEVMDVKKLSDMLGRAITVVLSIVSKIDGNHYEYAAQWNEVAITVKLGGWRTLKANFQPFRVAGRYCHWHVLKRITDVRKESDSLVITFDTNGAEAITPTASVNLETGKWTFDAQRPIYASDFS